MFVKDVVIIIIWIPIENLYQKVHIYCSNILFSKCQICKDFKLKIGYIAIRTVSEAVFALVNYSNFKHSFSFQDAHSSLSCQK
jgi:hypothetical protein